MIMFDDDITHVRNRSAKRGEGGVGGGLPCFGYSKRGAEPINGLVGRTILSPPLPRGYPRRQRTGTMRCRLPREIIFQCGVLGG